MNDAFNQLFDFEGTLDLLALPFVQHALIAAAVLGIIAGLLSPLIVARGMAFAVHGTSELAFTGGAAALLAGLSVSLGAVIGAVAASLVFGILGLHHRDRDSVIGVILAFGLGLGVLMLAFYQGRSANKFGLLTGSIVSIDSTDLAVLAVCAVIVIISLSITYRPLLYASVDPAVAEANGVPIRTLGVLFAVLIGITTALAIPIVGAILVLTVMVTPGAAASKVSSSPAVVTAIAIGIAEIGLVGGTILSLGPGLPISGYATTLIFACYLTCQLIGRQRHK